MPGGAGAKGLVVYEEDSLEDDWLRPTVPALLFFLVVLFFEAAFAMARVMGHVCEHEKGEPGARQTGLWCSDVGAEGGVHVNERVVHVLGAEVGGVFRPAADEVVRTLPIMALGAVHVGGVWQVGFGGVRALVASGDVAELEVRGKFRRRILRHGNKTGQIGHGQVEPSVEGHVVGVRTQVSECGTTARVVRGARRARLVTLGCLFADLCAGDDVAAPLDAVNVLCQRGGVGGGLQALKQVGDVAGKAADVDAAVHVQ